MLSRREFLRTGSIALAGAVAAACGKGGGSGGARTFEGLIGGRRQRFTLVLNAAEVLPGRDERVPFALLGPDQLPVQRGTPRLFFATSRTAEAVGPFAADYQGGRFADRGAFVATVRFPADGQYLVLVEAPDGAGFGVDQVPVGARTKMPKPGEPAVSVATPTARDHRGVEPYCTLTPPCSMHGTSLDRLLAGGKPTVLLIATPRFCSSRLCGPEVEVVQEAAAGFPGVGFHHIEVYRSDEPDDVSRQRLSPAAAAWRLETEPVVYFIRPDGTILDRWIGPVDEDDIGEGIRALTA